MRFEALDPAIDTDVSGPGSTAARMDNPLAAQAARTMLIGTLAPDTANGLHADQIADTILSPEQEDYGVIASAVQAFLTGRFTWTTMPTRTGSGSAANPT